MIMLHSGNFEDQSIASLDLFFVTEEEKTPTEIADLLRGIINQYVDKYRFSKYQLDVKNLLSMTNDTLDVSLEDNKFYFSPHKRLPISKIISLSEAIDYFTDRECWYFQKENLDKDGQVNSEVFDVIWEMPKEAQKSQFYVGINEQ
jgi:hypothetical protein